MQRGAMRRPRIIAMKGRPCTGKSTVAGLMAEQLNCPLFAQDDVRDSISILTPSSATPQLLDDISFQSVCDFTVPQLLLGRDVIIDSSLSRQPHLDLLLQLQSRTRSLFVVVECKPRDRYVWRDWLERRSEVGSSGKTMNDLEEILQQDDDYFTEDVSKIVVDTTDYVRATSLLFAVDRLAAFPDVYRIDFHNWVDKLAKGLIEPHGVREITAAERKLEKFDDGTHYFHYHRLTEQTNNHHDDEEEFNCRVCLKAIAGPRYKCAECELIVHKSCAELPKKTEIKPQDYPPLLKSIPNDKYIFSEIIKCNYCESHELDFNECPECVYEAFLRSAAVPSILHHPCHEHPLQVMIVPIPFRSEFVCKACGDSGKHIRYYCYECGFVCHLGCGLLPRNYKQERHRHTLTVSFFPPADDSEEFICDACETTGRNPNRWMYYCAPCEFSCHLRCMTFDP